MISINFILILLYFIVNVTGDHFSNDLIASKTTGNCEKKQIEKLIERRQKICSSLLPPNTKWCEFPKGLTASHGNFSLWVCF